MYALGNTNIVIRVTKDGAELSKQEMDEGVAVLEEKVRRYRPESVCIVGKSIWESVWRVRHRQKIEKEEFRYGWQEQGENMGVVKGEWEGAKVFVATTTSGLAAGMKPHEKEEVWRGLGGWVKQKRKNRGIPDEGCAKAEVDEATEEVVEDSGEGKIR
jgi:mismatch-specific thymine-DNA glycosylase